MEDISKLGMMECFKVMERLEISGEGVENVEQASAILIQAKKQSQEQAGWSPGEVRHF